MKSKILCICLLFYTETLHQDAYDLFTILNVGQGSWSILQTQNICYHFDMGGEFLPKRDSLCENITNILFLTHYDRDHINWIKTAKQRFKNMCLYPIVFPKSLSAKKNFLKKLPLCPQQYFPHIKRLYESSFEKTNDSYVYLIEEKLLVTGDAPAKIEKILPAKNLKKVEYLVLGHHGSRTSTSQALLKKLPQLKMAFASCRYKKYGHPHKEVVERLLQNQTPLLSTEAFGNITLEF